MVWIVILAMIIDINNDDNDSDCHNELITIITPEDTIVDAGQITGLPIGIISVDIDSITLNSVTGLPPNFDYYCDPPSCGFIGGTTECAELYSIVDPTVNDIGSYQIVFETTAYVSGIPLLGNTTLNDPCFIFDPILFIYFFVNINCQSLKLISSTLFFG